MATDTKVTHTGYEVCEDGRVFSVDHNWRGYGKRELQQTPNADGYPSVRLTIDGRRVRMAVHRLVAESFLPPRLTLQHEIRHLDGNKRNPHADNLTWGTRKDNAADRERHGRTYHMSTDEARRKARLSADSRRRVRAEATI